MSLGDGVTVGEDTVIGPRVVCYRDSRIGRRVVLKAGAVIGGDGFGYLSDSGGHHRIPHVGICVIEDDVEIGSNSTVDRGSVDDTVDRGEAPSSTTWSTWGTTCGSASDVS